MSVGHEELLNIMLGNTCHVRNIQDSPEIQEFSFDLHCRKVTVVAESLTPSPWNEATIPEYRILSYKIEVC